MVTQPVRWRYGGFRHWISQWTRQWISHSQRDSSSDLDTQLYSKSASLPWFRHSFNQWPRHLHSDSNTRSVIEPLIQPLTQTVTQWLRPLRPWFSHSFSQGPRQLDSDSAIQTATESVSDASLRPDSDASPHSITYSAFHTKNQPAGKVIQAVNLPVRDWRRHRHRHFTSVCTSQSITVSDLYCQPVVESVTRIRQALTLSNEYSFREPPI